MAHENDHIVTGRIFVRSSLPLASRELGQYKPNAPDGSKRHVLSIAGIVAVPLECKLEGEHLYTLFGVQDGLTLRINPEGQNVSKVTRGLTVSDILIAPIWKV